MGSGGGTTGWHGGKGLRRGEGGKVGPSCMNHVCMRGRQETTHYYWLRLAPLTGAGGSSKHNLPVDVEYKHPFIVSLELRDLLAKFNLYTSIQPYAS